jgi:hypothetical protein
MLESPETKMVPASAERITIADHATPKESIDTKSASRSGLAPFAHGRPKRSRAELQYTFISFFTGKEFPTEWTTTSIVSEHSARARIFAGVERF